VAATCDEEVVTLLGEEGAIGNVVRGCPGNVVIAYFLCGVFVEPPRANDNDIVLCATFDDVFACEDVVTYNAS
jgi:hypothetical protein